jgi:hypothetical protein
MQEVEAWIEAEMHRLDPAAYPPASPTDGETAEARRASGESADSVAVDAGSRDDDAGNRPASAAGGARA